MNILEVYLLVGALLAGISIIMHRDEASEVSFPTVAGAFLWMMVAWLPILVYRELSGEKSEDRSN